MAKPKRVNPFYILLVLAGATFAITAFAYGVMTVRQLQASRMAGYELPDREGQSSSSLFESLENDKFSQVLSKYGAQVMVGELILLTIGTVGAIAYDQRLDRLDADAERHPAGQHADESSPSTNQLNQ